MVQLTKGMVKVLILIVKGLETREKVSQKLRLSKTWVSDNLTRLEKLKFIAKIRKGKNIYLKLAETGFAQEFKNLIESRPHLKFEEFLYGLNFRILICCLFSGKTSQSVARQLSLDKKTVQNRLPVLMARGLLTKNKKFYLTNKKAWPTLYNFLQKFRMFHPQPGKVLWKFEEESLFLVTKEEDIKGRLTGFSQYPRLGVGMRGIRFCCYLPQKRLSKEEIFIHSLLEISDSRELMLALVFYLKHKLNKKKLENLAMKYDCLERLEDLEKILKQEKTKIFSFIKEKELREFFKRYRIKWKGN